MPLSADGIALNGNFLTIENGMETVSAIAWKDGRICAVGTESQIRDLADRQTNIIDLEGKVGIPGFIDNHAHPLLKALDDECVDLSQARNLDELITTIGEEAESTAPGEWIITSAAWHDDQLEEKRLPTCWDLDRASEEHPIALRRGGIVMVVNSMALRLAQIDKNTANPEGGTIFRDGKTGLPNGILDAHAKDLVEKLFPPFTHERKINALRRFLPKLSANGITSIRDAALFADEMRIYQQLHENDELNIRVNMLQFMHPQWTLEKSLELIRHSGPVTGFGSDYLKIGALKFFCDGGFEQALMTEHYEYHEGEVPAHEFYGLERTNIAKMRELIIEANRHGWQVANHCAGDKAIDYALDIYEEANRESPIESRRWSLEHAIYPRRDQIDRVHRLGVLVTVQPHTYIAASSMTKHWGNARAQQTYPLKSWLDNGVWIGSGSDLPTMPFNPLITMQFWSTRQALNGDIINADEAISVEQALRLQTVNNAYLTFEENHKGSLRTGKWADVAVLSDNPLQVDKNELDSIQVLKTIVGGNLIYERS